MSVLVLVLVLVCLLSLVDVRHICLSALVCMPYLKKEKEREGEEGREWGDERKDEECA